MRHALLSPDSDCLPYYESVAITESLLIRLRQGSHKFTQICHLRNKIRKAHKKRDVNYLFLENVQGQHVDELGDFGILEDPNVVSALQLYINRIWSVAKQEI